MPSACLPAEMALTLSWRKHLQKKPKTDNKKKNRHRFHKWMDGCIYGCTFLYLLIMTDAFLRTITARQFLCMMQPSNPPLDPFPKNTAAPSNAPVSETTVEERCAAAPLSITCCGCGFCGDQGPRVCSVPETTVDERCAAAPADFMRFWERIAVGIGDSGFLPPRLQPSHVD